MTAAVAFDATDSKYQIKDEFKPDKESQWPYPKEEDGWTHAHHSIRAEMRALIESVEATNNREGDLKEWEITCIKKAWATHEVHIHAHHENEDNVMVPFLTTRFQYPDKYAADHDTLLKKIDAIAKLVGDLKAGGSLTDLHKELVDYETMMLPHLEQEEVECLPLCRAYFTPAEIGPIIGQILSKGPKVEVGSFIHCMGPQKFRKQFMAQEHIPFFVWYIDFVWRLKRFEKEFVVPTNALKTGVKP